MLSLAKMIVKLMRTVMSNHIAGQRVNSDQLFPYSFSRTATNERRLQFLIDPVTLRKRP